MSAAQTNSFIFLWKQADETAAHVRSLVVEGAEYSSHPASDSTADKNNVQGNGKAITLDGLPKDT